MNKNANSTIKSKEHISSQLLKPG